MLDPLQVRAAEASASPNQHLYPPQEPQILANCYHLLSGT